MNVTIGLVTIIISIALDFFVLFNLTKKTRYVGYLNVILISFSSAIFIINEISALSLLLAFASVFRIVNIGRVLEQRLSEKELYVKFKRSIIWFSTVSLILVGFLQWQDFSINLTALLSVSLVGSVFLLFNTLKSLHRWRPGRTIENSNNTPTVTVGIPARNETQDLPECIESMLASDYPKLEIIVLDDCSHDKTPEIIKEYAHQGVRFIKGEQPDKDWLPKNQAMNKIFDESKGDILIFTGVDVRFSPKTVRHIVNMLESGNDMISVLPKRSLEHESSVYIQPLRYWWELSVPRFFGARPPVLSTCWGIKRESLKSLGEFDSYRKSVQPEAHFAKRMRDSYRFIISGSRLGVTSVKPARDQYDTAIRTRYPQTKRRLESTFLLLLAEIVIFFSPLFGLIYGITQDNLSILVLSTVTISMFVLVNTLISSLTVTRTWFIGIVSLPFLLIEEWFILIRSMLAYEYGSVIWKDRNICLPMYKVEKQLPKVH